MEKTRKKDSKVLFITTKNVDYLRNVQEIAVLKNQGYTVDVLCSHGKNYAKRLLDIYLKLIFKRTGQYDKIFVGFAPQLIVPIFNFKLRKSKLEIDFFISVYDTFVNDRKKFKSDSIIGRFMHKIDCKTIQCANHIVVDTEAHKKYFVDEFGADEENVEVMYLEADKSIYFPQKVEKDIELKNKFLVVYFGSILPLQGVDVVIEAVKKLQDCADIHFFIIGPMKKSIERIISDTVTYYDWLPQEELAKKIAMSDLCLAGHFCPNIDKADRTIPGKAYIYEAMDKTMILGDTKANRELFKSDGKHFFVERGNAEQLAEMIERLRGL